MRFASLRHLFAIAMLFAVGGCASVPAAPQENTLAIAVLQPQPLKLCPVPAGAPAGLVNNPGYAEFAVTVTGTNGSQVDSLKQSDFEPYSGAQSFPVAYFLDNSNTAPKSIILVIDTSGSMTPKLPTVQKALGDFLSKLNLCDEVALFAFSDRSYLLQPFTTDHRVVIQKLSLFKANGETAMYDSLDHAIEYENKSAHYPRRSLILITDGMDNQSRATKNEEVARVEQSDVRMFLVGIGDPNASNEPGLAIGPFVVNSAGIDRVDAKTLNDFAAATGGTAYIVAPMNSKDGRANDEFAAAISKIGNSLGHDYSIGLVLPANVTAASVSVAVPSHPDATVASRVISPTVASTTR